MHTPVARVDYRTDPSQYRHWKLSFDGAVATLALDVAEDGGIRPGYKLKLNSYDLGVDIELHDALNRIRFEHPEVRSVVVTSLKDRVFCSGANIFMLGVSSHAWKVNFCKFTNETRNGIEDTLEALGAEVRRRRSTALAPAAATSSRWRATRSCWSTTARRRCRCPRCRCSACCPAPAA